MTRRCSHCSTNGHNSRTCPSRCTAGRFAGTTDVSDGSVKLFGVRLTDNPYIKKSLSVGNLLHYHFPTATSPSSDPPCDDGFLSDDPDHGSCSSNRLTERKKGTPWTGEEHRLFLLGLQRLGKGDWRGISRNFVVSRTPTQVASHAQKHFIRQTTSCRKRRSSLFDILPDTTIGSNPLHREHLVPPLPPSKAIKSFTNNTDSLPPLDLSLSREAAEPEPEPELMEETSSELVHEEPQEVTVTLSGELQYSAIPTFIPYLPFWPVNEPHKVEESSVVESSSHHQVVKPTPVIPKEPVNVDELVGMSKLKLSESELGHLRSPQFSLNLLGSPSRQSAFHASVAASVNNSDQREGKNSMIRTV